MRESTIFIGSKFSNDLLCSGTVMRTGINLIQCTHRGYTKTFRTTPCSVGERNLATVQPDLAGWIDCHQGVNIETTLTRANPTSFSRNDLYVSASSWQQIESKVKTLSFVGTFFSDVDWAPDSSSGSVLSPSTIFMQVALIISLFPLFQNGQ